MYIPENNFNSLIQILQKNNVDAFHILISWVRDH